jgi:hypothetical protein
MLGSMIGLDLNGHAKLALLVDLPAPRIRNGRRDA